MSTTLIKDRSYSRTSNKTGNPTNGGGLYGNRKKNEDMKNRKHEDEKKEKAEVGLVAARENSEAIATLLAKWSN